MKEIKKSSAIVFLLAPFIFFGQAEQNENFNYNWFDSIIAQKHTGLYNGKQYVDTDINKIYDNKHAYFLSDKELVGTLIYDGQIYYDIPMKYNLENDKLIVTLKSGTSLTILQLISDKISEFTIDNYRFVRIKGGAGDNVWINGFYRALLEKPSFSLLKKHKKIRKKRLEGNKEVLYQFVNDDGYVLLNGQNYNKISSKGDIIKIYPSLKKEINLFYKDNKRLKKSQPDGFIQRLFEKISQSLLSKSES